MHGGPKENVALILIQILSTLDISFFLDESSILSFYSFIYVSKMILAYFLLELLVGSNEYSSAR